MRLRVLGSSGAEFPGFHPPAFLMDDSTLLDAGTIGPVLDEKAQWKIRYILITHAHLDHTKGIPFLADNIVVKNKRHHVTLVSIPYVLRTMKNNLLNNKVWPDFTAIPDPENAVLRLKNIKMGKTYEINGYKITAYRVTHAVTAAGYIVEDSKGKRLLYTGDTGPTEAIWKGTETPVDCALIEVSMPNSMRKMAVTTGHLTPELLRAEIKKMKNIPRKILITHLKPQYLNRIKTEVKKLGMNNIEVLTDGDVYTI